MRIFIVMLALLLVVFTQSAQAADVASKSPHVVDINAASAQELADGLPGIGPAKAARIVQWRDVNGSFTDVGQLQEIKGIGPKTVEKLREFVRVGSAADAKRTRFERDLREERVRADIRRVVTSATLGAQPESREKLPVRPWYRRSALEILRAH